MRDPSLAINKNIMKEHKNKFSQIRAKYFIHQGLNVGWSFSECKWHNTKFIMSLMSAFSFLDVITMDLDLVVTRSQIKL